MTDEEADRILEIEPIAYNSTSAVDNPDWLYYGVAAEHVAKIDPLFATWKTHETHDEIYEVEEPVFENGEPVMVPGKKGKPATQLKKKVKKSRLVSVELDDPVPDGADYARYTVNLIHVVKRQDKIIKDLEARLAKLEGEK
jgi:hypothetical protein